MPKPSAEHRRKVRNEYVGAIWRRFGYDQNPELIEGWTEELSRFDTDVLDEGMKVLNTILRPRFAPRLDDILPNLRGIRRRFVEEREAEQRKAAGVEPTKESKRFFKRVGKAIELMGQGKLSLHGYHDAMAKLYSGLGMMDASSAHGDEARRLEHCGTE